MRGMLLVVVAMSAAAGCGSDVQAGCTVDADCASRCELDVEDFPGGLCTLRCTENADCPSGTVCIDKHDGLCVAECSSQDECADFGDGYTCQDRDDIEGRKQLVCLGE